MPHAPSPTHPVNRRSYNSVESYGSVRLIRFVFDVFTDGQHFQRNDPPPPNLIKQNGPYVSEGVFFDSYRHCPGTCVITICSIYNLYKTIPGPISHAWILVGAMYGSSYICGGLLKSEFELFVFCVRLGRLTNASFTR